ncbi:MAG: CHAT domain-containing protein [Cytophagaceae bacterium]|nr:CHAT domain-containing protein [Gemmatimonadaceae bacterium]
MLTLHIRIEDAPAGQPYPLTMRLDTGQPGWEDAPIAQGTIPRDLVVPNAPLHPDDPGKPLTVEDALAWYHEQEDPSPTGFEAVGDLLFRLLDQPGVSAAWKAQRDAGWARRATGESLRTVLAIVPADLRDLPWELINHKNRWFFTEAHGPWHRAAESAVEPGGPLPRPMKLLVIVGCKANDNRINWREEVQAILDVACPRRTLFDVEVLERPTIERLTSELAGFAPDILHFVGHGIAGDGDTTAGLELWSGDVTRTWTAREMFQLLSPHPPRVVFINACRTAEFAGAAGSWRVASALLDAGVPAVIGMQGDVLGDAAAMLSRRFYEQVSDGVLLDAAVSQARLETMQSNAGQDRKDWSLLTLTLACEPARVLALEAAPPAELSNLAAASGSLLKLSGFVGRRRDRREVKQAAGARSKLLVLAGLKEVGKSDFLKTCLEQFAMRGSRVVYVDLATGGWHDAIGLLRQIRGPKALEAQDILRPLLYPVFADFNEELNALLDGRPVPGALLRTPASGVDHEKSYRADTAHPDTIDRAFESFARALVASANGEPLFVVLDHLGGPNGGVPPDEFRKYIRPKLVDLALRKELGPVRLVLALRQEQVADFDLTKLVEGDAGRTLNPFAREDWRWLANEYLLVRKLDRNRGASLITFLDEQMADEPFTPDTLAAFAVMVGKSREKGP